ncbi:hypothetical protein pEaSNUABM11_00103 [Erwinia phage pEa_SNUABM_11]|nr:hypothetical protein pEaSNUABM11_00103 [Erwinia phage pEa_SNUABM_11]
MDDNKELRVRDPAVDALLRKTTAPSQGQQRGKREEGGTTPTRAELTGLASSRLRSIRNSNQIFQALPELETIVTIATTSVLSTKDLINTTIIYDNIADIPLDLRAELIEHVRHFNDEERKLPKKLYDWLYRAYRAQGATPVMFISDAGFDELFNLKGTDAKVGTESAKQTDKFKKFFEAQQGHIGSLKPEGEAKVGLESVLSRRNNKPAGPQKITIDLKPIFTGLGLKDNDIKGERSTIEIGITDNERILLAQEAIQRVAREDARSGLYGQLEQTAYEQVHGGLNTVENGQFNADGFKDATEKDQKWLNLGDLNEAYHKTPEQMHYAEVPRISLSDDNKLEFIERELPAASTLPVIIAGDIDNPIGYLTIVDELGNFINEKSSLYGDANFMNYLNNDGATDSIINRANLGMGNGQLVTPDISNRLTSRFGELAEGQLAEALSPALGGVELDIGVTEMFGRVILTRHLAKRYTQVVYIPAENLCYFATDFDDNGIGVSITERSFVISTIRMALLFAGMNAAVLNSARHLQYDITLSPDAMNGKEAVDRIKSDILNGTNRRMPMWGNMTDVWSMATNSGIAFNVEGNDHYSSHKVSVSDTTPDYKAPDMDFDQELLRRTCHLAGVDPDLVLTPENLEFASQIYSKSLLVTQQIVKKQEKLEKPLNRYVTNGMQSSPRLQARMIETIANYVSDIEQDKDGGAIVKKINEYMRAFINGMQTRLPPPDTSAASSQMDLFDKRSEFWDKLADLVVTDDRVNAMNNAGIAMDAGDIKNMVKSFYARQWLRQQGIENEFFDLVYDDERRQDIIKTISDEEQSATKMLMQLAGRVKGKLDTVAKQSGDPDNAGAGIGSSQFGGDDDDSGGGDDLFSDGGDEDDFDMGDEDLGDSTSEEESTETNEDDNSADDTGGATPPNAENDDSSVVPPAV